MNGVLWVMPALAVAAATAPLTPAWVEGAFSTRIYPALQRTVTPLSNAVPVALFDILLFAVTALVVFLFIRGARAAMRERRVAPLGRMLLTMGVVAATGYLWFLLFWGLNYRRVPMTERLALGQEPPRTAAVVQLGMQAASRMNALHAAAHREGWQEQPMNDASLRRGFAEIQRAISDAPPAVPGRLKRTILGPYFRWTSVDGMVNPFALEVLANPDLLPFERPFVAAHEWAHLAGFADEAEASFVGWLACLRAGAASQYSAWLLMYWQVNAELTQEERAALAMAIEDGPRRDLEAIVTRLREGEWPLLRTAGWEVYDQYLKANRVEEGVRSYGLVVTLILRAKFDEGWIPVRRAAAAADPLPGS
jgi:hypothetical protein